MMNHARHHCHRLALSALLAALALLLGLGARTARAEVFGGLGQVGAGTIKAGVGGKGGEVDPSETHDIAIDPKTHHVFIADELLEGGKLLARLQEFEPEGAGKLRFIGEKRTSKPEEAKIGGIAIDANPASGSDLVYMLVNAKRPEAESEFDHEKLAADKIWRFEAAPNSSKELPRKLLTEEPEELKARSNEPKQALVEPAGIAVDPTTHDVVILGQQDESLIPEEELLHAAVERVHADGTLGTRYVDDYQGTNCLDEGQPSPEEAASHGEKPCAERSGEPPRSPIVTPLGRVYVELENEVWEIPAPSSTTEPEAVVHPDRVFVLPTQTLLTTEGQEGQAGTMAFAPLAGGKGLIFIPTRVGLEASGVLVLDYQEEGGKAAVSERGWTGGQPEVNPSAPKCIIAVSNATPLVAGGDGEEVLVFDSTQKGAVELLAFGRGGGAEACGNVKLSPPAVKVGEQPNVTSIETGKLATLTSTLTGANAKSTKWKIVFDKGKQVEELASGYQHETTELPYEFTQVGEYEITETVESDSLGHPTVVAEAPKNITTIASPPKVTSLIAPKTALLGEPVTFEAHVTDDNEAKPHLTYRWSFGDGSPAVVEKEEAAAPTVVHKTSHAFISRCSPPKDCIVKLEVLDEAGASAGKATAEVAVGESAAEKEAHEREAAEKAQHEREAAEKAQHEREAAEAAEREAREKASSSKLPGGPTLEQIAHEKAEREQQEVLAFMAKHNPEARVAGTSLTVSKKGVLTLKISCPASEVTACAGTITLRTLTAVSARPKKAILTLANGSFNIASGQTKVVTLHLSVKARTLLARIHVLKALATVVSSDAAKVTRTTKSTVTLRRGKH